MIDNYFKENDGYYVAYFLELDDKNTWKVMKQDGQSCESSNKMALAAYDNMELDQIMMQVLEETWHLISDRAYDSVYPEDFAREEGSEIAKAMDIARKGYYLETPDVYPAGAVYTYLEKSCDWLCQVGE